MNSYYKNQSAHKIISCDSNWDIYADKDLSSSYAIATVTGCSDSNYGDKHHIKALLDQGYMPFKGFTDKGLEYMEGLNCRVCTDTHGKQFSFLSFI